MMEGWPWCLYILVNILTIINNLHMEWFVFRKQLLFGVTPASFLLVGEFNTNIQKQLTISPWILFVNEFVFSMTMLLCQICGNNNLYLIDNVCNYVQIKYLERS